VKGANGEETREYLVLPEAVRREVCAGFDSKSAGKVLRDHGRLVPSTDRTTQKVRLPGMGSTRVYVLTAKMWEAV
jgi:hypothetical protein